MNLTVHSHPLSSQRHHIWPVSVIIVVVLIKAPVDLLPVVLPGLTGVVTLLMGAAVQQRSTATTATTPTS